MPQQADKYEPAWVLTICATIRNQRREYGHLFISQPAKLHQTRPVDLNRCRCCRFYCRVVRLIDKSGSRLCEDSRRFFAIPRTGHG